ncbi:MAG TPA: hypothetical protein VK679_01350 [Gemmatimonadaceae bacterium]|jgi:hypothetical protein|nr:hypothetical protein [Gemmatimonadaceae bacterium]
MTRQSTLPMRVLLVALVSCTTNPPLPTVSSTAALSSLTVADSTPPADGATLTKVSASLDNSGYLELGAVTFTATSGGFVPLATDSAGTPVPTASLKVGVDSATQSATALLQSPSIPGPATVSASAGQAILQRTITFGTAYPDTILLVPSSLILLSDTAHVDSTSDSVRLTIAGQLVRTLGHVSRGQFVTLADADTMGVSRGLFDNATPSDSLGNFVVHYIDTSATYRGRVAISAQLMTPSKTAHGYLTIQVTP